MTDCISELEISLYIDDELAPKRKKQVEKHLASCPECSKLLKEYESSSHLFDSLKSVAPLSDLEAEIKEGRELKAGCSSEKDISMYIDGELSPKATRALKSHLARCDDCRLKIEELKSASILFRALGLEIPSMEMDKNIIAQANEMLGSKSFPAREAASLAEFSGRSFVFKKLGTIAAAAAVVGLVALKAPVKVVFNSFGGYRNLPVAMSSVGNVPVFYAGDVGIGKKKPVDVPPDAASSLDAVLVSSQIEKKDLKPGSANIVLRFDDISDLEPNEQGKAISRDVIDAFGTIYKKYKVEEVTIWIKTKGTEKPIGVISFDRYGKPIERDWQSIQEKEFSKI